MKAVVDASAVIAALELDRPQDAVSMHELSKSHEVLAPHLLPSEVGHFLHWKAAKRFGRSSRERSMLLEAALQPIRLQSSDSPARALAGGLAEEHGLSFYDAEYLAAALQEEAALLITEDRELLAAARKAMGADRAFDWDGYRLRGNRQSRAPGAA